jgi:hypothetical protein
LARVVSWHWSTNLFIKYCDFAENASRPKRFFCIVYCVPVSATSQLNGVIVSVFDAAVSVRVAWIVAPAFRTVFCRFHERVKYVLALVGVQLFVVMVSASGMLPVFLMYIVCSAPVHC